MGPQFRPVDPNARPRPASVFAITAVLVVALIGATVLHAGEGGGASAGETDLTSPGAVKTPRPINEAVEGITTFRGNATRSYYGEGPVPRQPQVRWRHPRNAEDLMCSESIVGVDIDEWCGTGWTGQPNVIQLPDDSVEVREGAYDGQYHFLDGLTGEEVRPNYRTRDLAKGSATSDPDGFPLYYGGSRDGHLRILALDRPEPTLLWSINAATTVPLPLRNDDWDGAPLIIGDYMLEGGENGWLYVVRLHRGYDPSGLVTVAPEIVATIAGFDDQLLRDLGDKDVSIENSVVFRKGVVYFANSGGLVQGWDIRDLLAGGTEYDQVFRFWAGDDVDASLVMDQKGFLYVAAEYQRFNERAREVGQLLKLDPRLTDDPVVWSLEAREIGFEGAGGSWSTPALYGDVVVFSTAAGRVLIVDRLTGGVVQELSVGSPSIASPVVVDDVLILGDCLGDVYAWDIADLSEAPPLLWTLHFEGCVESTPAVWRGWLYFGTREGYLYGIADPPTA
ncbi:MAG TPA: PQQ-binding-like beta-propeller repeat protein [Actinomycetota bacterium]